MTAQALWLWVHDAIYSREWRPSVNGSPDWIWIVLTGTTMSTIKALSPWEIGKAFLQIRQAWNWQIFSQVWVFKDDGSVCTKTNICDVLKQDTYKIRLLASRDLLCSLAYFCPVLYLIDTQSFLVACSSRCHSTMISDFLYMCLCVCLVFIPLLLLVHVPESSHMSCSHGC